MTIINDTYAIATLGLLANPDLPLIGNVTDDDTLLGVTGTYEEANASDVRTGTKYGEDGTEFTGTYGGGASNDVSLLDTRVDLI